MYMKPPGGYGDMPRKVAHLSLYALKQGGWQWARLLVDTVIDYGTEQYDMTRVFRMAVDGKVEPIMDVHVDDIAIAGSNETYRELNTALILNIPWYNGCAFKRDGELETLENNTQGGLY